ncbi:MAG: SH3 domain-containing protein [Vallitaleaceae bacterium]|nr:SH3 domain-containing protein [Vallitaleaceae bacterium]
MKKILWVLLVSCFLTVSCSKADQEVSEETETTEATQATEAIEATEATETTETTEAAIEQKKVLVNADVLNVRKHEDAESDILGKVYQNQSFIVIGEELDDGGQLWYLIEYEIGKQGWIASWFCIIMDENKANDDDDGIAGLYYAANIEAISEYSEYVELLKDHSFVLQVNLLEGMGQCKGTYSIENNVINCKILSKDFSGFVMDKIDSFILILNDDGTLTYKGEMLYEISDGSLMAKKQ